MNLEFNRLKRKKYVGQLNKYDRSDQEFIVKVRSGEFQYIKDNYKRVTENIVRQESFIIASTYSEDDEMIRFLFEKFKIDVSFTNCAGYCCLTSACRKGHIEVIKYFIEELNMNINKTFTKLKASCLMMACSRNTLEVVKYLIEVCGADVGYKTKSGSNCMSYLHSKNEECGNIAAYLVESIESADDVLITDIDALEVCIPLMKKNKQINHQLKNDIKLHKDDLKRVFSIIKSINPLILDSSIRSKAGMKDPYCERFSKFKQYVDKLIDPVDHHIDFQISKNNKESLQCQCGFNNIDFAERDELLFVHNSVEYYGKRSIVCECMNIFKDAKDIVNFDNVELGTDLKVSKDTINKYILSCYTGQFDLSTIDAPDIIDTLRFIDRYPTKYVSIDDLEDDIVRYYSKISIPYCSYIKEMSERYQLRTLYLDIKCKDLINSEYE